MSVGLRMFCGFAVTLALIAVVAWTARTGVSAIESRVAGVPAASSAALEADRTALDLTTLRWRIAVYSKNERVDDLTCLSDRLLSRTSRL